ncbi:MAG: sigma 54-interacting transcriptional regulator [Deltaproteobacteria bacterium]|nr:sigma 54-interacting transcriptional regulator [Deltaproteobacteria bacterium]
MSTLLRNRYQFVRPLGTGASASVFEVLDLLAGNGGVRMALKALPAKGGEDGLLACLREEFRVLAVLRDPVLCRVYDFGRIPPGSSLFTDGGYFLTRDLVEGVDLKQATFDLGYEPKLPTVCRLLADAARGLDVLHRAGLRHGDFKPANCIVEASGSVKLIDFGLVTVEHARIAAGTLAYLAPEILAARPVDRRSDLYALGITLFELATGGFPWGSARGGDIVAWHQASSRHGLAERIPSVRESLARAFLRLVAIDPDERFPTAAEAAAALECCADELAATKRPPPRRRSAVLVLPGARPQVGILERMCERRLAGHDGPPLVEIVGDIGTGKSTTLLELTFRAELAGAEVVRADSSAQGTALGAMGAALAQISALCGRALPDADSTPTQLGHFAAITQFLEEVTREFPLVIVADDVDHASATSRALLRYLAHALPKDARLFMACARRPSPHDAPVATDSGLLPMGEIPRVVLGPLDLTEVQALVESALGLRDDRLAEKLLEHTGGNPLYLVETLKKLCERELPHGTLETIGLPSRLEEIVEQELLECSEDEARLLSVLAVLGGPGSEKILRHLGGGHPGGLMKSACSLMERGLVVHDPSLALHVARRATARVVYDRLSPHARRELHAECARALEAEGASDEVLARHDVLSQDRERGTTRAMAVADRLAEAQDHSAALELFEAILPLCDEALAIDCRLKIGEQARLLGDATRASASLAPLFEAPEIASEKLTQARLTLGRARSEAGDFDGACDLLSAVAESRPVSEATSTAVRELTHVLIKRGQAARALHVADRAVADLGNTPPPPDLACARALARGTLEDDPTAVLELEEAATGARSQGNVQLSATLWNHAANLSWRRGAYARAQEQYRTALHAAEEARDVVRIGTLRMNLAALLFYSGDHGKCLEHLVAAVSLLDAAGALAPGTWARRNLAHVLLEIGAWEQARVELRAVLIAAGRLRLPLYEASAVALLGVLSARSGDLAAAARDLSAARDLFVKIGDRLNAAETWLDLAELHLEKRRRGGHWDDSEPSACDHALSQAEALQQDPDPGSRGRRLALRAELLARMGNTSSALEQLSELEGALSAVRLEGARHASWSLHATASTVHALLGSTHAAEEHRTQACSILESMASGLPSQHQASFWQDPRRRSLRSSVRSPRGLRTLASASAPPDAERLYRLLEIYRRMSSERDMARLLELTMDTAVELTGAERGFLLLAPHGEEGAVHAHRLDVVVARNLPMEELSSTRAASGSSLSYSRSIAEKVFKTGEPVVSQSAWQDPQLAEIGSVHALKLEAILCIPVHVVGRPAGVLYMESRFQPGRFTQSDLRLLLAFGDQVAILLCNARLLEENARRAEELARASREIQGLLAERTQLLEERTEELAITRSNLEQARRRLQVTTGQFGIVGRSPAMESVFQLIERTAKIDAPVLILGDSGTGKELVARAIHQHGPRAKEPMVSVNCGALPESLLESELFGHVRGAFTGADRNRRGLFQVANRGTLFLDEVGDTPPRMQVAILRAVQEKTIRPVGSTEDVRACARLICATNRPLDELMAAGKFRADLFYRLNVVPIYLPALKERADDMVLLVDHFLALIAARTSTSKKGITRRAMRRLREYPWPGNVRQLEHALMNACVMADAEVLDVGDFSLLFDDERGVPRGAQAAGLPVSAKMERLEREKQQIVEALEKHGWNKSRACQALGIPRRTFYRRLAEHDIE